MTPAEKAVIEAARDYVQDENANGGLLMILATAVEALGAERAESEQARPWSLVVAEDEIWSTKTEKWYRVVKTTRAMAVTTLPGDTERKPYGPVTVQCEGMAKPFTVPADGQVKVRRSEMGQAVDVWAGIEVISS